MQGKLQALACWPHHAWVHLFLSHMVVAAYAYHVGSGAAFFVWQTLLWSCVPAAAVILAYFLLLWLTKRAAIASGVCSPPFFLITQKTTDENEGDEHDG